MHSADAFHSTQTSPQQLSMCENQPVGEEAILTGVNDLTSASCADESIHFFIQETHWRPASSSNGSETWLTITITWALPLAVDLLGVE